jgi:DNA primase
MCDLIAFVKTTGSRGLHVLVPLNRRSDFDEVRAFARQVAVSLVTNDPEDLTIDLRRSKRRGRILVDTAPNAYAHRCACIRRQGTRRRSDCRSSPLAGTGYSGA